MLDIALPKGRLGDRVYSMLKQAGYECPSIEQPDRRLIFENPETGVRYFWVKPSDVTIYVERGAADLGIAGKDILLENPAGSVRTAGSENRYLPHGCSGTGRLYGFQRADSPRSHQVPAHRRELLCCEVP